MSILLAAALTLCPTPAVAVDEDAEARRLLDEIAAKHAALERGAYELTLTFEGQAAPNMLMPDLPKATIAFERTDDGEDRIVMHADGDKGRVVGRTLDDGGLEAFVVDDNRLVVADASTAPLLAMTHGLPFDTSVHRMTTLTEGVSVLGVEVAELGGHEVHVFHLEPPVEAGPDGSAWLFVDTETHLVRGLESKLTPPDGGEMTMTMTIDWLALGDEVTAERLAFDVPDDAERVDFDIADLFAMDDVEMPGGGAGDNVGKPLPAFELRTEDGDVVTKESLAGKVVVLDFWATWCGPCLMAMPGIERVWQEHRGGDDVVVLGMNVFERGDPGATMREEGFTYTNLLEADAVAEALGYMSIPQVVVVDQQGFIRHELSGYSEDHEAELARHVGDLLAEAEAREGDTASGEAFPAFDLRTGDGASLALSDLNGKVAVFDFWATWCGPCIRAMPGMQHIHETLGASDDVVVLGMNIAERGDPAALMAEKGFTYTNVLEADAVAEALGITSIPEVIVIDRNGAIVERITGFVADHEERVTSAIRAALAR